MELKSKKGLIVPLILIVIAAIFIGSTSFVIIKNTTQKKSSPEKTQIQVKPLVTPSQAPAQPPQNPVAESTTSADLTVWTSICQSQKINNFTVKVEYGDSQTTLSRKALEQYFNDVALTQQNSTLQRLNGEESVYAEDYIRKNFNIPPFSAGSTVTFPCQIIENSALAARALSISQEQNLEKYKKNATEIEINDIIQKNMQDLCKKSSDLCKYSGVLSF